ncbi:ABC transporter substrate-binding protein [Candidatus Woesearchaeota archaeon]|nr:ABC transporter substrate-binding protein [Candidatus Woesearchaeota archaeon]
MKLTKLAIAIAMLTMILISACNQTPTGEVVTKEKKEPIKIGYLGPLTGDAASYGETEVNVIKIALKEINSAGGIAGRPLKVLYEDGQCRGKEATTAAKKLIEIDNVKIILGGLCSAETLAMAPITEANKILVFSALASNPDISDAGEYIFRNVPTDHDWSQFAAETIYKEGYKEVSMLTENTPYAIGVRDIFKERFIELGGKIIADEVFEQNSKDYRSQITKIKSNQPDAIFLNPQAGITGGLAAKQIREFGITAPIYSSYVWGGPDSVENAGEAAEGILFFDAPGLSTQKGLDIIKKYKQIYGDYASEYLVGSRYDSVHIIADALIECNENTECIKDYLYDLKDYDGAIGTYSFKPNGDMISIQFELKEIRNKKPVVIG